MKKILILSLLAFCACKSTTTIERSSNVNQSNIGKSYSNIGVKQKTKGGFSLRTIPCKFVMQRDSIHIDSLNFGNSDMMRLLVGQKSPNFNVRKVSSFLCMRQTIDEFTDFNTAHTISIEESNYNFPLIIKIDIDSLRKNNKPFYHFKKQILTDTSYILRKNYQNKPLFLKKGEIYFQNSIWSGYSELVCSGGCGSFTIRQIENRLNYFGYKMKEDNILSKKELRQLHRFQKDKGLKVGALDIETLKKLGLQY